MHRGLACALACLLVVAAVPAPAAAADGEPTVRIDPTLGTAGSVTVTVEYPGRPTADPTITAPWLAASNASIREVRGFERVGETDFEWDGETASPTLTLAVPVDPEHLELGGAVDPGPWALAPRGALAPLIDGVPATDGNYPADVRRLGEHRIVGGSVFYGATSAYERTVSGRTVTLVVPDESLQLKRRATTFDAIGRSDGALAFGSPLDDAQYLLLPGNVSSAFSGVASGQYVTVREDASQTRTHSTLIHEYVHTRQHWYADTEMKWFTEGSADYYAGLVALNLGYASYGEFRALVSAQPHPGETLASGWSSRMVPYQRGRYLLAALDAGIRRDTDGSRTLLDVVRRVNGGRLTYPGFRRAVVDVSGNESRGEWLDRYVLGGEVPTIPDDPSLYTMPTVEDPDGDDLSNDAERELGTSPFARDTDGDGLGDASEREGPTNATLLDTDDDGLDDGEEAAGPTDPANGDTDGDGADDGAERDAAIDPTVPDTDGDGLDDGDELDVGSDPLRTDTDGDGLDDGREDEIGTSPMSSDTDQDGLSDATEHRGETDPTVADTDGDGRVDGLERLVGSDPTVADTDGDGIPDDEERNLGTDPDSADTDGDGLVDPRERDLGTDPASADTDGDGHGDAREVRAGTDPSRPTGIAALVAARLAAVVDGLIG